MTRVAKTDRQKQRQLRNETNVEKPSSQKRILSKKRQKDKAKLKVKALVPRLGPPGNPNKIEQNQNHIQRNGFMCLCGIKTENSASFYHFYTSS